MTVIIRFWDNPGMPQTGGISFNLSKSDIRPVRGSMDTSPEVFFDKINAYDPLISTTEYVYRNDTANFEGVTAYMEGVFVYKREGETVSLGSGLYSSDYIQVLDAKLSTVTSTAVKIGTFAEDEIILDFGNGRNYADVSFRPISQLLDNETKIYISKSDDNVTTMNVSESIYGLGGEDSLNAKGGHDTIDGGSGKDTISGGSGNDFIIGGKGRDVLNGNHGNDNFVFNGFKDLGDVVGDFNSKFDSLHFDASEFPNLSKKFDLDVSRSPEADSRRGTFLFDKDNGKLSWDADGSGAGKAKLIATLDDVSRIELSDFVLF